MAINLRKITRDVAHQDQEVRVLALTTVLQLTTKSAENKEDFKPLYTALSSVATGGDADMAFLAKKGQAHVRAILESLGFPIPETTEEAPKAGAVMGREEVLAGLRVETDPIALATLVGRLKALPGDDVLQIAVQYTRHKEPKVRTRAAEVVSAKSDERSRTVLLVPMLADPDARVRATAASGLKQIAPDALAATLTEMLTSTKIPFKEAAVWAAGRLAYPAMLGVLAKAAVEPIHAIRARAARGFANHKAMQAQGALTKLTQDPDGNVREEAKRALIVLQGKVAPPEPLLDLSELAATLAPEDEPVAAAAPTKPGVAPTMKQQAEQELQKIEKLFSGKVQMPKLELAGKNHDQLLGIEGEFLVNLGRTLGEMCRTGQLAHPEVMEHYYDYLEYRDKLKQRREKSQDQDVSLSGSLFKLVRNRMSSLSTDDPVRMLEERLQAAIFGMARTGLALMEKGEIQMPGADDYVKRHAALRQAINTAKGGTGTPP